MQEKAGVLAGLAKQAGGDRSRHHYRSAAHGVTRAAELVREQLLSDAPDPEIGTSAGD